MTLLYPEYTVVVPQKKIAMPSVFVLSRADNRTEQFLNDSDYSAAEEWSDGPALRSLDSGSDSRNSRPAVEYRTRCPWLAAVADGQLRLVTDYSRDRCGRRFPHRAGQ